MGLGLEGGGARQRGNCQTNVFDMKSETDQKSPIVQVPQVFILNNLKDNDSSLFLLSIIYYIV